MIDLDTVVELLVAAFEMEPTYPADVINVVDAIGLDNDFWKAPTNLR